jgi:hypothetical protein
VRGGRNAVVLVKLQFLSRQNSDVVVHPSMRPEPSTRGAIVTGFARKRMNSASATGQPSVETLSQASAEIGHCQAHVESPESHRAPLGMRGRSSPK